MFGLEAMSMGKPVVATTVGSLPEIVRDGVTGLLIPPENPQKMADAIIDLLTDSQRVAAMSGAAHEVASHYTYERMTDEVLAFYERVLERTGT